MKDYVVFKRAILIASVCINTVIFILLAMLHFYWSFGGKHWYDDVLPTNSKGLHRMNPTTAASLVIAVGLLFLALITIGNQVFFDKYVRRKYFKYGNLTIAVIFFLRAIGDFRLVGFFKTIRRTRFGINDTQIFSPLCLAIALLSMLIFILANNNRIAE